MDPLENRASGADAAQALIEELLRAGLALTDLIASLIEELPEDVFTGRDNAVVLVEMVAGSCLPAVEAAGEEVCWAATALIGAVIDRVLEDLRAAAELAQGS